MIAAKIPGKIASITAKNRATAYAKSVSISPKWIIELAIQFSARKVNTTPASHPSQNPRRTEIPPAITFSSGASATHARKFKSKVGKERSNRNPAARATAECRNRLSGLSADADDNSDKI